MKKSIGVLLSAALLIGLLAGCSGQVAESVESTAATEVTEAMEATFADISASAVATVVTASDFQENGTFFRFEGILNTIAEAGCPTPDCALLGGDYNIETGMDPDNHIRLIREGLSSAFPDFAQENAIFVQGNHDNASSALTTTGAHDMGSFVIYAINEDDFPSAQSAQDVEGITRDLGKFFSGMVAAGDYRPVLVATHVPLHHNSRHDNGYAKYLVDVLNHYGQTLDILVLFGHSHSGAFDDDIGGSVNLIGRDETMRVQIPGEEYTQLSANFTQETLHFTYMNYGYVGYSANTFVNALTVGVIQICPDSIEITRFTTEGEYSHDSIPLMNPIYQQKAA
ncbi:MAG: metallophosphoesterase [Oscillospiraceae bacterium]|nr:metallophosphoesterase [Oscillospiraceae bacterium]